MAFNRSVKQRNQAETGENCIQNHCFPPNSGGNERKQKKKMQSEILRRNYVEFVKRLTAILFSVLVVWMQVAPMPVLASPICVKPAMGNCVDCCDRMACCVAKPTSNSQPIPAIPAQSNLQNQISLLAPAVTVWNLPENPANFASSVFSSRLITISAPLYARNCSLLL
jgi:hypothetical protein